MKEENYVSNMMNIFISHAMSYHSNSSLDPLWPTKKTALHHFNVIDNVMCIMGILYYLIYLYSVYLEAFLKIDEENIVNLGDEK